MSNQTEPAPYQVGLLLRCPVIGIVIGICALLTNALVFTGNLGYLIIGFCVGIVGIVANMVGITNRTSSSLARHRKMAITGLICSIVSLMPFIALATYSVSDGRTERKAAHCQSRLKEIGLVLRMYADDNDDRLPIATHWQTPLRDYYSFLQTTDLTDEDTARHFCCPSADKYRYSYGMNSLVGNTLIPNYDSKSNPVLAFDCSLPVANANGGPETVDFRHRLKGHQGLANIVFVDGHAKTASKQKTDLPDIITIDQVQWKP